MDYTDSEHLTDTTSTEKKLRVTIEVGEGYFDPNGQIEVALVDPKRLPWPFRRWGWRKVLFYPLIVQLGDRKRP